jgi:hypothetical protein
MLDAEYYCVLDRLWIRLGDVLKVVSSIGV